VRISLLAAHSDVDGTSRVSRCAGGRQAHSDAPYQGRGFRFCCNLNEDIINALTTSSRTYVNTILRLCLLNTDIAFRINLEDMMIGETRSCCVDTATRTRAESARTCFTPTSSRGARPRMRSGHSVRCSVFPSTSPHSP